MCSSTDLVKLKTINVLVASPPNTQRAQLLTQELLKQDYVAPRLKSSLQKLYGRHHNVVDHYEMSISQITMDLYFLCRCFLSSITAMRFTGLDCIPPGFWMGSMLLIFLVFCVVLLCVLTSWAPCCGVRSDFRKKRCSVHFYLQLFAICVCFRKVVSSTYCVVFLFFFLLCSLSCQFLWIVHF